MIYFLEMKKTITYLQPKLLLPVHGGQSSFKKQQQNFMLTILDSIIETLLKV
jgi:hypothetical protein